jgi:hypothetical protein
MQLPSKTKLLCNRLIEILTPPPNKTMEIQHPKIFGAYKKGRGKAKAP